MTGSIWDLSTTPGSNTTIAAINIAPGCPSSSVGPALREYLAEVKGALIALASGGTADAITATAAPAPTALIDGMRVLVRASAANVTTTPTFQLNALGTTGTIKKLGSTALVAGDISGAGHAIELEYVSSDNHWELLNPAKGVGTVAVANGGTGDTSLAAHGVLVGNGSAAVNVTATGTAGQILTSNGASADPTFQAPPQLQKQYFTASGTFITPVGTTTASVFKFTVIGGGGGGGGANGGSGNQAGGGGGAGATAIYYGSGVAAGSTAAVTVGSAGAAGSNAPGAGGTGGDSSVVFNGTMVTAHGGGGGGAGSSGSSISGGAGGTASNGALNVPGGGGGASNGSTAPSSGNGGASTLGGGAQGVGSTNVGVAGSAYGAGGGGAAVSSGLGQSAGGAGAPGIVIVEWVQ